MADLVLKDDDRLALMMALECRSPVVRQARVAHVLLLVAKGIPAATVADLMFLPEPVVRHYCAVFANSAADRTDTTGKDDTRQAEPRVVYPIFARRPSSGPRPWHRDAQS